MTQTPQEIIKGQLQKLPQAIRAAILQADIRTLLQSVAKKHDLRIDQAGLLENETMLVMLGLEHPDSFIDNLVRNANVPRGVAAQLATDVNNQIFKEVRHLLVQMHEEEKTGGTTAPAPHPAAATPAARTLGTDIAAAKLSGNVHLPADSIRVTEPASAGAGHAQGSLRAAMNKPPSPVQGNTYVAGADPYREPTH